MNDRKLPPAALPHQVEGTAFLSQRTKAALFDEQGLGKTRQLIDAVTQEVAADRLAGALIICPNSLKTTWAEEIEKASGHKYAIFGAGKQARRLAFASLKATFYVINYEAVASELPALRALLQFKHMALVLDESHRIKTPDARVTRAVHDLREHAARRYILTGTPVANKPEDLWSQFFFLDGGEALGATPEAFRERYCTDAGGYANLDEIRELIPALSLRREKAGTVDLPPKHISHCMVTLRGDQERLYTQMRDELAVWVQTLTGEEVLRQAEGILARLVRLAQLASNPRLLDASYEETPAKFVALDDLLAQHLGPATEKAVVWTSFVDNIPPLLGRYEQFRPVALHGGLDGDARDAAVNAFRQDSTVRLMIANPAAAREGLTLTSARHAVYLDRTFNLVDFLQSQDRIHRLSQTRPCEIFVLVAQHTIDEYIDFVLAQKHRLAQYTQQDIDQIRPEDLALSKPTLLRALLSPR